jgi:hypothetical protein
VTLILNGTDNSATTPAVTGTDTDTGVYYPAANQVALATNGTLALLVNASQQVGLGTSSPNTNAKIQINGGAIASYWTNGTDGSQIYIGSTGFDNSSYYNSAPGIGSVLDTNTSTAGALALYVYTGAANSRTRALNLNANGNVALLGATVSTSGTGITFPATQSASSEANTLDDYEEGTFTPTLSTSSGSPTYTFRTGQYTKVGRIVTVGGIIGVSNSTSLTGVIQITLPFQATSQADGIACGIGADASGFSWPVAAGGGNTYYATWVTSQGLSYMNMTTLNGVINYNSTGVGASWYMRYSATYQAS